MPTHPNAVGFMAGMLRRTGAAARGRDLLEAFEREQRRGIARARAESHIVCRELDAAAGWLSQSIAERDPGVWLALGGTVGLAIKASEYWPGLASRLRLPAPPPSAVS